MMLEATLPESVAVATAPVSGSDVTFRTATVDDGADIWRLVRNTQALDDNSPYLYLLAGAFFRETIVVAEVEGELLGFVLALRPPTRPDSVFVWQVGVDAAARGRGLASHLLDALIELDACADVSYLEATVTPTNKPSRALFQSFARRHGAACKIVPFFASDQFPRGDHEEEELFRIGPLGDR